MEYCNTNRNGFASTRVRSELVIKEYVPFFADAAQQMRDHGIVNGGLKPENILQCGFTWKVTDFDLAEYIGEEEPVAGQGTHGTDVVRNGELVIAETDLYSVGTILYTLRKRYINILVTMICLKISMEN